MFTTVLTPLDGSPESARALLPAKQIADRLGVVLSVKAYFEPDSDGLDFEQAILEQVNDLGGVPCEVEVSSMDRPVAELLEPHLADHEALVVMSTRGYGRTAALVGSVANEIVAQSNGPVLLLGPECTGPVDLDKPLVVATDSGPETAAALELATALVDTFELVPVVVNVMDPKTDRLVAQARAASATSDVPLDSAMVQRFAGVLGESTGGPVEFEVLHSAHPGKAVADYATEIGASMITMATQARSGMKRLAFGSVTADVLSHAHCPVMAFTPAPALVHG